MSVYVCVCYLIVSSGDVASTVRVKLFRRGPSGKRRALRGTWRNATISYGEPLLLHASQPGL